MCNFFNKIIFICLFTCTMVAQDPCDGQCLPDEVVQTLREDIINFER